MLPRRRDIKDVEMGMIIQTTPLPVPLPQVKVMGPQCSILPRIWSWGLSAPFPQVTVTMTVLMTVEVRSSRGKWRQGRQNRLPKKEISTGPQAMQCFGHGVLHVKRDVVVGVPTKRR